MCRVLEVSKSGYYAWRTRPESARAKIDRELTRVIRRLHGESHGVYGSPKIREDLKDEGYHYGRHKVARLNRPQFARHLSVIQNGYERGAYEQQEISGRIQDRSR
jgi:putative transposase